LVRHLDALLEKPENVPDVAVFDAAFAKSNGENFLLALRPEDSAGSSKIQTGANSFGNSILCGSGKEHCDLFLVRQSGWQI
jgi:hypothetical protein